MNKYLFLSLVLTSSLIFSCKKDNNSTSSDTTNNTNINSKCKNEVITRNDSILITGCSDFETSLIFITGGYLLSMSEKTDNSLTAFEVYQTAFSTYQNVRAYSASALRPDGWYSQDGIWEHLEGVWKWRVKATDSYRIIFTKLPLSKTPASLPVTYNSAGRSVIGPFRLSGSTTFTITCPDAKLAGFTAELFDATGAEILENYANILDVINIDANNNQINNYSKVITKQLSEGNYLMRVSANKNATWTVSIN